MSDLLTSIDWFITIVIAIILWIDLGYFIKTHKGNLFENAPLPIIKLYNKLIGGKKS